MKRNKKSSLVFFIFTIIAAFTMFALISVEARKHNHSKKGNSNKHHNIKDKSNNNNNNHKNHPSPGPSPAPSPTEPNGVVFNIFSFGAKGDGVSDDSEV